MTAHEFVVELFNAAPEIFAVVIIWGFLTFLVFVSHTISFIVFAIPDIFRRRECFFLDDNPDGSFSLRSEICCPAFYRVEKILRPRKKR